MISEFSLQRDYTEQIRSSVVKLNKIGLIVQPCFTPEFTLMGSVSSSFDKLTNRFGISIDIFHQINEVFRKSHMFERNINGIM